MTKLNLGTTLVLFAAAALLFMSSTNKLYDLLEDTRNQIVLVTIGLTGYAVVILGVIAAPTEQRRSAVLVAGLLLLPTFLVCMVGAHLITLGWSNSWPYQRLGVFGVVLAFTVPALLAAGILWICVAWFKLKQRRDE